MPSDSVRFIILVSVFGVVGVLSRVFIGNIIATRSSGFPSATFLINILGSFLIGVVFFSATLRNFLQPDTHRAVMIGLLGGFTTFSAVSLETLTLLNEGRYALGMIYLIGGSLAGLLSAFAGMTVGNKL